MLKHRIDGVLKKVAFDELLTFKSGGIFVQKLSKESSEQR
jgi:hypothetical protein